MGWTLSPWQRWTLRLLGALAGVVACAFLALSLFVHPFADYTQKSQFSEAPSIVDGLRVQVEHFHRAHDRMPRNNAEAGLPAPASITGKYIGRVEVQGEGVLMATFSSRAMDVLAGNSVRFTPVVENGAIRWRCDSERVADKYCPQACECRPSSLFRSDD
jgi:type IV pilus assembly protein PilA